MSSEKDAALLNLKSSVPTVRAAAASRLLRNPDLITTRELMLALERETVPAVRRLLNKILESRQVASTLAKPLDNDPVDLTKPGTELRPGIASIIRHELSPAIGWIRYAAHGEIANFENSKTNDAVNKLRRRLEGLISILKMDEPLKLSSASLPDLVSSAWPDSNRLPRIVPPSGKSDTVIHTDTELFHILLVNVFENAIDAASQVRETTEIVVQWGTSSQRFWVRISNPFDGEKFDLSDVMGTGRSSKKLHQGHGLTLIKNAADRLGLSFALSGVSGVASSIIEGERVIE